MLGTIGDSLRLLRPRSLARTRAALDALTADSRDVRRTIKSLLGRDEHLSDAAGRMRDELARLHDEIRGLREQLDGVARRESQLRAIVRTDAELEGCLAALPAICDVPRIAAHVRGAVDAANLRLHPCPHVLVENLFPEEFYAALLRGIPPAELFADKPANKQHLNVPLALAPLYSRRVWNFLVHRVVGTALQPALLDKFRDPLDAWIAENWPQLAAAPFAPPMEFNSADGRIMRRGRGYYIAPHRDPKWGFLTGILYLARDQDSERWGTSLLEVDGDDDAPGAAPYWIPPDRCRAVVDVPFRRNSMLMFLNSTGAHTARIADDAEPADLRRYIYQFRIGPSARAIPALRALLSPARRALWDGKARAHEPGGAARPSVIIGV